MIVPTQQYYGTTQEWEAENPLLMEAVFAFEETERKDERDRPIINIKIGNGVDRWNDLRYFDTSYVKDLTEKLLELTNKLQLLEETLRNKFTVEAEEE